MAVRERVLNEAQQGVAALSDEDLGAALLAAKERLAELESEIDRLKGELKALVKQNDLFLNEKEWRTKSSDHTDNIRAFIQSQAEQRAARAANATKVAEFLKSEQSPLDKALKERKKSVPVRTAV